MTDIQDKISAIQAELKSEFVERDEQVTGAICALLSKHHILMIGAPGTAKSLLTDRLCSKIEGAQYFQMLLTKFSVPEEVFGPISLKALEQDHYKRITTNMLPEAHIAFLDEIFKANSAILNSLLTLINERKFKNNGAPSAVPLQTMFGASNELPEGEELNALYDRFLLRYVVGYIAEDNNFKRMMTGTNSATNTTMTLTELAEAQKEAGAVVIPDDVMDAMIKIRNMLKKEGVIASDRRFKQSLGILKAHAWINGRKAISEDDMPILQHILWSQPTEIKTVQRVILETSNPLLGKLTETLDMATEIFKTCNDAVQKDPQQASTAGIEANMKLKKLGEELIKLKEQAKQQERSEKQIDEAIVKVTQMNKEILKNCLGLDMP